MGRRNTLLSSQIEGARTTHRGGPHTHPILRHGGKCVRAGEGGNGDQKRGHFCLLLGDLHSRSHEVRRGPYSRPCITVHMSIQGPNCAVCPKCPISSSTSVSAPPATVSSHRGRFTAVSAICPSTPPLSLVAASASSTTTVPGWRTAWATATIATSCGFWWRVGGWLNRSSPAFCSRSSGLSPCLCTSSRTSSLSWRL